MPAHDIQRRCIQFADNEEAPSRHRARPRMLAGTTGCEAVRRHRQVTDDRRTFRNDQTVILQQRNFLPSAEGGKLGGLGFTVAGQDGADLVAEAKLVQCPVRTDRAGWY